VSVADIRSRDLTDTNRYVTTFSQPWNVLQPVAPNQVFGLCLSFPQVKWRNEERDRPLGGVEQHCQLLKGTRSSCRSYRHLIWAEEGE